MEYIDFNLRRPLISIALQMSEKCARVDSFC